MITLILIVWLSVPELVGHHWRHLQKKVVSILRNSYQLWSIWLSHSSRTWFIAAEVRYRFISSQPSLLTTSTSQQFSTTLSLLRYMTKIFIYVILPKVSAYNIFIVDEISSSHSNNHHFMLLLLPFFWFKGSCNEENCSIQWSNYHQICISKMKSGASI